MKAGVDTLNTSLKKLFLQSFELLASCDSLKCQTSMFSLDFNTSTMMKIVIFIVIFYTVVWLHNYSAVDTLYKFRFREVSGLSIFKNFENQTTGCGDNAYSPVGCFIF